MNKKLMAVAVAGALAAPAAVFAQASNVQIYGKLNLGLDNYSATGSAAGAAGDFKSRYRVYDSSSRLGFRGTEDLGGGLRAVFLMESGVAVDTGAAVSQNGGASSSAGTLSSRVGHVGLQGGWGLLTIGKSNVWWGNFPQEQAVVLWTNTGVLSTFGILGRGMSVGVSRQNNTVQYTSPTWGGINAVVSYSPNRQEAQGVNLKADGKLWAVTVQGALGPITGGYDWVKDEANSPAAGRRGSTTCNKFRVGWPYQPGAQIALFWTSSELNNGGAAATGGVDAASANLKQKVWALGWDHLFGNIRAIAQWGKVSNATGCVTASACADTNATTWLLGANYVLSKRTHAYVTYNAMRNARNYNLDYTAFGSAVVAALPNGADPRIVAVGMVHNF